MSENKKSLKQELAGVSTLSGTVLLNNVTTK